MKKRITKKAVEHAKEILRLYDEQNKIEPKQEEAKEFEAVIIDCYKWQLETFPKADQLSKLYHLKEEVQELIDILETKGITPAIVEKVEMEYADCFMLLFGSAISADYTLSDIATMIKDKMVILRERKWGKPDKNGVVHHIPPESNLTDKP